jgi:hypothetical protein
MSKFIHITNIRDITPAGLDGHQYRLSFDIGNVSSGTFISEQSTNVTVTTSGTLQTVWGQTDSQIAQSSANTAVAMITSAASQGPISQLQPINLNTFTAPKQPVELPLAVPGALIPIPNQPEETMKPSRFSLLSDDIAEIRDQINAVTKVVLGGRLLELPQERAILDVYKPAATADEFRSRVQSLAGICTALNKPLLGTKLNLQTVTDVGSISLLERFLRTIASPEEVCAVCDVLKNINELRKGYPTHTPIARRNICLPMISLKSLTRSRISRSRGTRF